MQRDDVLFSNVTAFGLECSRLSCKQNGLPPQVWRHVPPDSVERFPPSILAAVAAGMLYHVGSLHGCIHLSPAWVITCDMLQCSS